MKDATAGRPILPCIPALPVVLAVLAIAILVNPLGYRGGGADDWHYLEAARCAAANGLCPPVSHWWARLTLVAPTGLSLALFGESRSALAVVPLAYALLALTAFTILIGRLFGRAEAMIAGGLLAVTPVVAFACLQPNVDLPELAFLAAAALALQTAAAGRRRWALAAGILLGLAILTRPTALAALPILALLMAARPQLRRLALPLLAGLAAVLFAEAAFYALWLGEPLKSWSLSLGHTQIATDQLPPGFQSNRGPLLNPDYIAGWRPAMGIHVHWTVDPVLNLLANPQMGILLIAALLLFLLARPKWRNPEGRALLVLLAGGMLWFGALTYGFAIDPRPRMFMPVAAMAAAIVAIVSVRLGRDSRLLAILPATALLAAFLVRIQAEPDLSGLEAPAGAWAALDRDRLSVDLRSARMLTLVPDVRMLPVAPAAGRAREMIVAFENCAEVRPGWAVARAYYLGRDDAPPPGSEALALCLLSRPEDPAAAPRS